MLADRHAGLLTVLHGNVVAGNVIFCGSRCINYTVFNGKGEVCAYLVVAVRCNYLRHGVGAVRQTDDVGLVFAVRNKGDSIRCLCVFAVISVVLQRVCLCQQSFPTLDLQHICIQTAVCPSDLDSCTCQFLRICNILLVHTDLRPVDSSNLICRKNTVIVFNQAAVRMISNHVAVFIYTECHTQRCIALNCSFCQSVFTLCQICNSFRCCQGFGKVSRSCQRKLTVCHFLAVYIYLCKRNLYIALVHVSDSLSTWNAGSHGNHIAIGIACHEGLIADLSCALIFHAFAVCVQLKDVIGLAAVQSVKGNRLFAVVAGSNGNWLYLCRACSILYRLITAVCVQRKQSNLNCMVNCRIAVLSSDLRYLDLSRILGGICDNGVCLRCVLGQGKCRNLIFIITAVIRNVECRICFCSGILGIENNRHLERSTVFDTLVTVHFKNVVRSICVQTVKGHIGTGNNILCCADLCVIVSVLGEQSHRECRCALDIICDQHLADGDAVLGFFGVGNGNGIACICLSICRNKFITIYRNRCSGIDNSCVRSILCEVLICQNAVGIGFQHVEIHTLGHIFKYHVLRACLGKGQGLHRCFLIANIIACRILGEQGKIEGVAGDVLACQCLGQRDIACIFGIGHADSLVRCGISSGDLIVGICRCVVVNLIALGICFQQVNVICIAYMCINHLLLDRRQVYVLHGNGRSRGLSCRNGDGNHITQPCGVIFIGKQCKVECCVLGFCFCQGLVDLHINGGVRCLYPDADLCRLCYHDSIAQNALVLIGVREAVPCDIFLAGLCHIAGNGCSNFDNNFLANLDGILQLDSEVYGIRRGVACPVHDIVLPQPIL